MTPQGPLSCGDALVDGCPIRSISGIGNRPWRATGSHYSRRVRWRIPPLLGVLTNSAYGANFSAMVNQSDTGRATGHSSIDPRFCVAGLGWYLIDASCQDPETLPHMLPPILRMPRKRRLLRADIPMVRRDFAYRSMPHQRRTMGMVRRCFDCQCHLRFATNLACVSVRGGKTQFTQFARYR